MDIKKVKAVLFDLDGTLLDTVNDIGTCVNDVMCRYGYPPHPLADYRAFIGHGAKDLVRAALPEGTEEAEVAKIHQEYVAHYRDNCDRFVSPYPGAREFLDFLILRGYKIGIITNKTEATAEKIVAKCLTDYSFNLLWGNNGIRPLKPSTQSAELACAELNMQANEILFVGDGDTDMEFASKAGFAACGVTWGYREKETLKKFGAHFLVDSFAELQKMF